MTNMKIIAHLLTHEVIKGQSNWRSKISLDCPFNKTFTSAKFRPTLQIHFTVNFVSYLWEKNKQTSYVSQLSAGKKQIQFIFKSNNSIYTTLLVQCNFWGAHIIKNVHCEVHCLKIVHQLIILNVKNILYFSKILKQFQWFWVSGA